jgi:hypothetical protein
VLLSSVITMRVNHDNTHSSDGNNLGSVDDDDDIIVRALIVTLLVLLP